MTNGSDLKQKDPAEKIADLICYWFSNGPVGTPNPEELTLLLRELLRSFSK